MTDLGRVVPENGGRVQFKLSASNENSASYSLSLCAEQRQWLGGCKLDAESGAVEMNVSTDAPGWLCDFARAVARGLHRQGKLGKWPRRVTRWRAETRRGE
jgi:hypothetical protein